MGLFNKLFGQSASPNDSGNQSPFESLPVCTTETALIERFGGIALEKQLDFGDLIGNNNWNVDVGRGTISFGEQLSFPMQILGTISHASQTWLWAWANEKSGLPASIIRQSLQLKAYGEANGIDLLRNDSFDFSKEELHIMGMIASGMFDASGYYIADYGQGAMVVTVKSEVIDRARTESHMRILTVFPQLISQFEMNHRHAFTSYVIAKGYSISETDDTVTATKNGQTIKAIFDSMNRLTHLNG